MGYVDYEYYKSLYGNKAIPEADFNRLSWDACQKLNVATTGIDNVRKLKVAFPVDEDDAETVKRCACKLIEKLYEIKQEEDSAKNSHGYITREDGTIMGKIVTSLSAGNESMSMSSGSADEKTSAWKAAHDPAEKEKQLNEIISGGNGFSGMLSGVTDANGVNLLFTGPYPCKFEG